jgi:diguanylate cyclase
MASWSSQISHGSRHTVVVATMVAGLVVFATSTLVNVPQAFAPLFTLGFYNVPWACAALLCFLRARQTAQDRLAWLAIGAGIGFDLVSNVYLGVHEVGLDAPIDESIVDMSWIGVYALYYIGAVLLVRARMSGFQASIWLDGVVAGLGLSATTVCLLAGPSRSADAATSAMAYPIADELLLVVVVTAVGLLGWKITPLWGFLGIGFAVLTVTNATFLWQQASGGYAPGGILDAGWPAAVALIASAAVVSDQARTHHVSSRPMLVAVPAIFALISIGLLAYDGQGRQLATAGVAAALACCLTALVRLGLTFREVQTLADTRRLARTDDLTGLANRRDFYERLNERLHNRSPSDELAVVILDLDRFKEINDSLGHAAGDALLVAVGPRVADVLRPGDLLARLGGDEFALFLEGAGRDEAHMISSRMVREIAAPFVVGDMTLHVEASVGIAVWPTDGDEVDELVARADVAMFVAKSMRTSVELYEPERDRAYLDRFGVIEALRGAIGSDQLVLHYQPKMHLGSGRVRGVEALVRWEDPARGLVPPDQFIPLAEQSGLMGALTAWVLREALLQAVIWKNQGYPLGIAVNVSASSLRESGFPDLVADLLRETGVPPHMLTLEITEDTVMSDRERCLDVLHRLRGFGIRVSVDDYGTGHSSLAYLRELPVDELKLDRSFVSTMNDDQRLGAIVESTIGLAHSLGLPIVAEGVETIDVKDRLTAAGCDLIQGYLLTRPLPGPALTAWLAELSAPRQRHAAAER